jgi:ElaB/YqjD/DUF883 family membrane-anchored ribosome-binding protein
MADEKKDLEEKTAEGASAADEVKEEAKKVAAEAKEEAKKVAAEAKEEAKKLFEKAKALKESGDAEGAKEAKKAAKEAKKAAKKADPGHKKKLIIIWAVVVVVLAGAIAGGLVWHEQPSFCNAICHTPMDYYVETYYSGNSEYGVTAHANAKDASGKQITCLTCHQPVISEQITEAIAWIGGNYKFDSSTDELALRRTTTTLTKTKSASDFCLNSNCHSINELEAATGSWARDPHNTSAHGGQYIADCSNCHRMHGQSVLICASCHSDAAAETPDGWATSDSDTRSKYTVSK